MGAGKVMAVLADRTVVLFLGVAVGAAMGYAFAGDIAHRVSPPAAAASAPTPLTSTKITSAAQAKPDKNKAIECAMPFQPRLLAAIDEGRKIRVGVFGDSFGDGVWAALYHQLGRRDGFEVVKYSQQSIGFTRYASLNLEDHVSEQLADEPLDIAVISFGANDTQGVMHKGKYAALLSPAWKEEIGARIARYVAILKRHGAIVYWVGLPVMRKTSFDSDISGMSQFFAEEMARLDVPFIDTRPLSVDESGAYAAYLPDPVTKAPRLMRANDGIHMSMGGYERLTKGLSVRIRDYIGAARQQAAKDGGGAPARVAALDPPISPTKPKPVMLNSIQHPLPQRPEKDRNAAANGPQIKSGVTKEKGETSQPTTPQEPAETNEASEGGATP